MAEAARDRSAEEAQDSSQEKERAKPELRIVREASPEEAEGMIDKMVEEFESTADAGTTEMRQEGTALNDFAEKQGLALNAEEANDNASITERAEAAADTLKSEVAAATSPAADAEAKLRGLEAQYKTATGDQKKALERQLEEATAAWQEALAATKKAEAAPAEAKAEAKVIPDFGQLLEHLSPEAQKKAADNFANADETSYGGMVSKQMTQDGVVRMGYKDGTIVETFPGGEKRSNLPEATGAERIPSLPDWAQEAQPDAAALTAEEASDIEAAGLLVLEGDLVQDKEELAKMAPGSPEAQKMASRIATTENAIGRKNTPDGLKTEIAAVGAMMDAEEAAMKDAPEGEKAMHAARLEDLGSQADALTERLVQAEKAPAAEPAAATVVEQQTKVPEHAPASERKARMLQLENRMRELEEQKKTLTTAEARSAIDRQMQEATEEWDDLREGWSDSDEKNVLEETQKEMKASRIQALENTMRELEGRLKGSSSPDEKAAISRELEAATQEWDRLRKESNEPSAPEAVAEAAAIVAAAETLAVAEKTPDAEKTAEQKEQVKAAEEVIATKSPTGKAAKKTKYLPPGGDYSKGGGGGDKGEKGGLGKKLEDAWDKAQKFFGGWTGIK